MRVKILLVILSILLSLGMAEGVLRIHDFYLSQRYGPEGREDDLWRYDELLGWKHRENTTVTFSSKQRRFKALCTTNSHGLRDEEYSYEKPKGMLRILLLGDSAAAGLEVEKGEVVDSVLERLIRLKRPCEVINAGVRGYGTDQSYLYLIHEGIKYDPDIVLYFFVDNDLNNNITIHDRRKKFGKSYFVLEKGDLLLQGVAVPHSFVPNDRWLMSSPQEKPFVARMKPYLQEHSLIYRGVVPFIRNIKPFEAILVRMGLIDAEEVTPSGVSFVLDPRWQMTKALIKAMKEFCDQKGIRYAVLPFTAGIDRPSSHKTPIEIVTEQLGVNLIESRDVFFKESKGTQKFCFQKDPHWNAKGHALAAKVIFEYLKEKKWF